MSAIDRAVELRAISEDFGLGTSDLHTARPDAVRFVIHLTDGDKSERIFVEASGTRLAITHHVSDDRRPLTYNESLELMLERIGA